MIIVEKLDEGYLGRNEKFLTYVFSCFDWINQVFNSLVTFKCKYRNWVFSYDLLNCYNFNFVTSISNTVYLCLS